MGIYQYFWQQHRGILRDKKAFGHIAKNYQKQLKMETTIVGDSALYSKDNLELLKQIKWRAQSSPIDKRS